MIVHWTIAKQRGLEVEEKWYKHKPEPVIENANIKMQWDFTFRTDREIQAWRPDIVLLSRKENECIIIDIGVPADANIAVKEIEKIQMHENLRREIARLWDIKTCVVPVVVSSLGMVTKNLAKLSLRVSECTEGCATIDDQDDSWNKS